MNNTYLFSLNEFTISQNGKTFAVNKNMYLKVEDILADDNLCIDDNLCPQSQIKINLSKCSGCAFYRAFENEDKYIELISCSNGDLKEKLKTKNAEVLIYPTFVNLF